MALLSLDVSFRNTGWVVFDKGEIKAVGVITTDPLPKKSRVRVADANALNAAKIARELRTIVDAHGVKAVVGELPSGGAQSAKALQLMALAIGTVSAAIELLGLPVEWVTPTEVKQVATGMRSASKDEMMDACRKSFKFDGFPKTKATFEHIADACWAYRAAQNGGNLCKLFG